MRRKTYSQWQEEQRRRYPEWDKGYREFVRAHGPRRRIRFLADEQLEPGFVERIRVFLRCRVRRPRKGMDDHAVWLLARREHLVLLTADSSDFWSERLFPIHQSPGVVVLEGRSAAERFKAFVRFCAEWEFVRSYRQIGRDVLKHAKVRISPERSFGRFWDGESIVDIGANYAARSKKGKE